MTYEELTERFHEIDRQRVRLIAMLDRAANYCPEPVKHQIDELLLAVGDTQPSLWRRVQ